MVCGILGEVLILKSYLVFEEKPGSRPLSGLAAYAAACGVVGSGALLSLLGVSLMTYLDSLPDLPTRLVYCALAAACLVISASCTHGLAGDLLHGDDAGRGWKFFQPGVGGALFVATQACAWILFSLAILGVGAIARAAVQGMVHHISADLHIGTGIVMVVGHVVLGGSLVVFRSRSKAGPPQRGAAKTPAAKRKTKLSAHLLSSALFLPAHAFGGAVVLVFALLPFQGAALLWLSLLMSYFGLTGWGEPAHTGRREWDAFRMWFESNIVDAMDACVGGVQVLRTSSAPFPTSGKYVFGYHPHGLLPSGAAYLKTIPAFKRALPGIRPVTLVASVLFAVPILRDIVSWGGLRKVSKRTFVKALETRGSVLLCPGGQAELVDAHRIHAERKEMVINVRHRGFIRLALQQGAALVPVLVFGELHSFRNLLNWPRLQQWTYRRFGFPIPFLMVGRWYTPLPNKQPVAFVVGDSIRHTPACKEAVTDEEVERLHQEYFGALRAMFEEYKGRFPEYRHAELVFSTER
mmetsp:Transcript_33836/g.86473  ORF Transcript_33836/g.86473 Transcript_33836/m.86473 type:complete len:522 (-) Transcript_33836:538-2103(-)